MPGQIPYQIHISRRARHVSLKITPEEGLVVVIPLGYDPRKVPGIVAAKADWIARTQRRLARQAAPRSTDAGKAFPTRIELASTGETWRVEYVRSDSHGVTLTQPATGRIRLTGAVTNQALCHGALRRWANRRAKAVLPDLLARQARALGFEVKGVAIRNQRTRWGSCSRAGMISLNQKLIFLPPELVRYVILHELCHMRVMSHSAKFWSLVGQFDPEYRGKVRLLRSSSQYLPVWA